MKLLTKNTDYAIQALLVLAKNKDKYLSARDISEQQKIPYQFLRRILSELIKHKLVTSKEGGGGGFKLLKEPRQIPIEKVMNIFQGVVQFSECMFRNKICSNRETCVLRSEITRIESIAIKEFSSITIDALLRRMK
jgi:Rrf2 family protein